MLACAYHSLFRKSRMIAVSSIACLLLVAAGCGYDSSAPYRSPTGADGLWTVASADPTVLRLATSQLLASGAITPATAIYTPNVTLVDLDAVAFDSDGTLWVASSDDSTLVAFDPASLSSSGSREARIIINSNSGSLNAPTGIAFDREHRLWVANAGNGTIVRFDRAQLATSGSPVPSVIISTPGRPTALAFDAGGSLWVSNITTNKVFSYGPDQLDVSGSLTPRIVISANGTSLKNPAGIAFDASGNLWVGNVSTSTVVGFAPAQLATGSPLPHVVISSTGGSLVGPSGLAFESDGSLWVAGSQNVLEKFPTAALAQTGAPPPSVRLELSNYLIFWSLAFYPKVAGLPLN